MVVTVNPIPVASANPASQSVCTNSLTSVALNSTVPGTNFSWTVSGTPGTAGFADASGNNITQVLTNSLGTPGTVTYVVTPSANGCVGGSVNVPITVNPLPTPSFSSIGGPYCISQTAPVSLLGASSPVPPPGTGIFSGTGVSGNDFVPSLAAVGSNVLTYTYTDANGCTNTAQTTVSVTGLPLVNFSGLSSSGYCIDNSTPVQLTGFPAGGTFSGPGTSGSTFVPSSAGVGLHSIVYTYSDANGCVNSQTQNVNVFALPVVAVFNLSSQYCVTDAAVTLTGFPPGGSFSGTGVSGNQFTPSVAGVGGPYSVTYLYTDANGCTNSGSAQTSVNAITSANAGVGGNTCGLSFQLGAVPSIGTGTWTQTSGPGTASFAPNANAANAIASVTSYGTYTFRWTEVNGACSSFAQVTVNYYQQPSASAGTGGSECDLSFNLAATPSVGSGLWTQTAGPGITSFSNSASPVATALVSQSGLYTFTWTETNGTCISSDAVNVLFTDQPSSNAGANTSVCDLDHTLNATSSFGTGGWSFVSGPGSVTFTAPSSAITDVQVSAYGQYVFQWSEVNGGCNDASTVTVSFNEQPVANAGLAGYECDLDFTFSAVPSVGVGTWSQVSGPGASFFGQGANDPAATVTVTQYGTYIFRWTEQNGTCTDSDDVTVFFYQQNGADAGVGGTVCGLTFDLNATATVGSGQWSATGPGIAFYTDDDSPAASVTVSAYGTYVFTWTETNGSCITSDQVSVSFVQQPVANAGPDGFSCGLDFTFAAVPSVGIGTWTLTNGPGAAQFDDANSATATVSVTSYGTYTFQWEEVNGICSDNASITVDFFQQPVADAGSTSSACGLSVGLAAVASVGSGTWTLISDPGSAQFIDETDAFTSVTVSAYGSYLFAWTETNGPCSDASNIVVQFYQQPVSNAGSDAEACGLQYLLQGAVSVGQGTWSQTAGPGTASFNNASSPSALVTVDQVGVYGFTWSVTNGSCTDVSSVTVNFSETPLVNAGSDATACGQDVVMNASASVGSGLWSQVSGPGISQFSDVTSASPDVSVSAFGDYTFMWSVTNGGCLVSDQVQVSFLEQPLANAGLGGSVCGSSFGLGAVLLSGSGSWTQVSGPGFSGFSPNAANPSATVQVSTFGQYEFAWTVNNASCTDVASITVVFNEQPVADIGSVSDQCGLSISLAAVPSAGVGTWSISGPGNGLFSPGAGAPDAVLTVSAFGTYQLTWTEVNGGCVNTATSNVVFHTPPTASFIGLAASYCNGQTQPVPLLGSPVGGVFSGPGVSGNFFVPAIAGPGTHEVTYTFTDANGCEVTAAQTVDVEVSPAVSFSGLGANYCASVSSPVILTGIPAGGVFFGTGVIGNSFVPSDAGAGTHVVTYSYTDALGCSSTSSQVVVVNPLPVVTISGLDQTYCANSPSVQLSAQPLNGSFSGPGITGFTFSPAVAGVGSHQVLYTVVSGNGCAASASQSVVVNEVPQAVVTPGGPLNLCQGQTLALSAPSGAAQYLWTNGAQSQLLTISDGGSYAVTVTNSFGCSATSQPVAVSVIPTPQVNLGSDTVLCPGAFLALDAGNPGDSYLWNTLEVTQQILIGEAGVYSVSVTGTNGCTGSDAITVSYSGISQPVIAASGPTTFCSGGSVILSGPDGLSHAWSTGATTQNILLTQSANVLLTVADANGCSAVSEALQVTVNPTPQAAILPSGSTTLCPGANVTLTATTGSSNYLWSPNGAVSQSVTVNQAGSYAVTVTDPATGCSATSLPVQVTLTQGTQPTIVANGPTEFCAGGNVVLSVEPAGAFSLYLWSTGATTPTVSVSATAQIGLSVIDSDNCLNQALLAEPIAITVWNPQPVVQQDFGVLSVVNGPFECYQWFRNGAPIAGAVLPTYTPEFSGNFYVQVCDANGCTANSSNMEFTVGIGEMTESYALSIHPNPTEGQFVMEADLMGHREVTISLSDMTGRQLMRPEMVSGVSSIRRSFNIGHLSPGVYYLRISGEEGFSVRPVIRR